MYLVFKMNTLSFSDDDCETMVELIRQHPPLYDTRLDYYKDENLKDNIWKNIAGILNKTDSECRKKWKLIRDSYNRHKRKQKMSMGAAPGKNSKWQFYERLRFLEGSPSELHTSSVKQEDLSSLSEEQEVTNTSSEVGHEGALPGLADASLHNMLSVQFTEPEQDTKPIPEISIPFSNNPEKSTSKITKRKRQQEFLKFLKDRHENRRSRLESFNSPVDDISTFAKHVEMMLRKLSARSRAMAKTEIFNIVSKYEIEDINAQSEISSYNTHSPISETTHRTDN